MRKIKASSNYLKKQTHINLIKAALCIFIFSVLLIGIMFRSILTLQLDLLNQVGLVLLLAPSVASYYYLRQYHRYNGGWQGEKRVAKLLNNTLSDDYFLINDLYLREGGGDVDHVVLGPNGIFVLETKNWNGKIMCNGDEWQRGGKRNFKSSPSRQVNRNVGKIKKIIDNSTLRPLNVRVEGIVVMTNKYAKLHINNPSVPVLKLSQLPNYLITHRSQRQFTLEQLEAIGKEIAKQKA